MDHLDDKRLSATPIQKNVSKDVVLKRPTEPSNNKIVLSEENKPIKLFKKPRIVLPEDEFVDDLQSIIVRDYFPELPKLKAQHEYLDALDRNDVEQLSRIQMKYSSEFTNGPKKPTKKYNTQERRFDVDTDMELIANEEGQNVIEEDKPGPSGVVDVEKHSVQSFVDTFVSEDTKSFHDVCEVDAKKKRNAHSWIYEAEKLHNQEKVRGMQPLSMDADVQLIEARKPDALKERPSDIDNWKYTAQNSVLFNPPEAAPTAAEYIERLKKEQKEINRKGTRLDVTKLNWKDQTTKPANTFAVPKVDISGKVIEKNPPNGPFEVLPTPDPVPAPDDSPFVTWGQIDGTPFRLDGGDMTPTPGGIPAFRLPEPTKREVIAHDMVEKIKKNNQAKRAFSQKMTDKLKNCRMSTLSRMAMMSPAAHKLAETKLGIKTKSTGILSRKTPGSVRLTPASTPRRTPRAEPVENIINEDLLSVRSSVRKL